jgi:hypothetical protein
VRSLQRTKADWNYTETGAAEAALFAQKRSKKTFNTRLIASGYLEQ